MDGWMDGWMDVVLANSTHSLGDSVVAWVQHMPDGLWPAVSPQRGSFP